VSSLGHSLPHINLMKIMTVSADHHRRNYVVTTLSNKKGSIPSNLVSYHLSLFLTIGFWLFAVSGIKLSEGFVITTTPITSTLLSSSSSSHSRSLSNMALSSFALLRQRPHKLLAISYRGHRTHRNFHHSTFTKDLPLSSLRSTTVRLWLSNDTNNGSSSTTSSTSSSSSQITTNESLAQERLAVSAAKRDTRKAYLEQDRQRNLRIKELLQQGGGGARNFSTNTTTTSYPIPPMHAIRVSVDKTLRKELRMNGREKRGRVFIEMDSEGSQTFRGLKMAVHGFFRCLRKSTYTLSAGLPIILEDGSIYSPPTSEDEDEDDNDRTTEFWPIEKDDDVINTFQRSIDFYTSHNANLTISDTNATNYLARPSILLHVHKDPNAPPPAPIPTYLVGMPDPAETESMTMLSFYAFPPPPSLHIDGDGNSDGGGEGGIEDPEVFGSFLRKIWKPFGALGRVYVAMEGVNAQMSVPTNVLNNFMACCMEIPQLGVHMENGVNIDPLPLTMEEFAVAGDMDGKPKPPFKSLNIRVRGQIVADGLDKALDWQRAGYDMPPMEWHNTLKQVVAQQKKQQPQQNSIGEKEGMEQNSSTPLIFDCRNDYETAVGQFEGAQPLNTTNFRDTWDVLKDQLKDTPNDTPIMTYCTGGIRCVKVGAYLTQELGFTNVSRLAGGIIAYDRTLNDDNSATTVSGAPKEEHMFKGTNYVFDGRVGRQITDDALANCVTCGEKANLLSNCNNGNCHKRMVQCETCRGTFLGTCSESCKARVINSGMAPVRGVGDLIVDPYRDDENSDVEPPLHEVKYNNVDEYSVGHSTPPSQLYEEIKRNTAKYMKTGAHMLSDVTQGRILANLAAMARYGRVLEIGTFVGYSTACFLEGAASAAEEIGGDRKEAGNRKGGAFVMSLERDSRAIDLAASHLSIMSKYGLGEEAAKEAAKMRDEGNDLSAVEGDSIYFTYKKAGCEIVRVTDALATVEAMANGIEHTTTSPFDIIFIDGDKTRFLDYVEACLCSNRVLKKGGYMVVDNVLWKGHVLDVSGVDVSQTTGIVGEEEGQLSKKSRRARKLANTIHRFNSAIVQDARVEVVMLPIRDGLSIIKKK